MPPVLHLLHPSHFLKHFCHDQVKLLLERMDSYPEEFLKAGRWDPFMPGASVFKHFTKVEQYLIRHKYRKLRGKVYRQQAYDGILETLVFKEEKPETVTYSAPPHLGIWGTSAVSTLTSNTLTLGDATLDAETIKHMKEHLNQLRTVKMGGK